LSKELKGVATTNLQRCTS